MSAPVQPYYPHFFLAVQQQDWQCASEHFKAISHAEKQADGVKRALRLHLPKKLRLVVSRSDILNVLISQDSLANKAEDIAGLVYGRKLHFSHAFFLDYQELLNTSIHAIQQAHHCMYELSDVVKTGFGEMAVNHVREAIDTLDDIEHDTDRLEVKVRKHLFSIEDTLPPVTVIFLYQIIQNTGELADYAQQIGKRLLLLLA